MINPMKEFHSRPVGNYFMANLHNDDPESLFVVRWDDHHFSNIKEFLRFTKRFASVMQFLGPEYNDDEIEEYFSEPPGLDWSTEYDFKNFLPQSRDLKMILDELFPDITIPWLSEGDHTKTITICVDDDYRFISHGSNGYANVFVAHDVDFEYE